MRTPLYQRRSQSSLKKLRYIARTTRAANSSFNSPGSYCGVPAQRSSQWGPEMVLVKLEDCSHPLELNVIVKEEEREVKEEVEIKEAEDMALKEEAEDMALKEEAEDMALKEEAEDMALKEEAEDMALKEEAEDMALKEEAEDMALKEEAEDMALKEEAEERVVTEVENREEVDGNTDPDTDCSPHPPHTTPVLLVTLC
ncbi:titin homolog isoform X2 [Oncorhynchus keta]|uniref:titin homolog isoform X2 n=1 Tax=Oncorhynchus keta TaxID=8018 RepID=UPI00227B166E|nr:titin homolog isoform X2 [Oncorhynchus keta]